jgi:hypothetical protein
VTDVAASAPPTTDDLYGPVFPNVPGPPDGPKPDELSVGAPGAFIEHMGAGLLPAGGGVAAFPLGEAGGAALGLATGPAAPLAVPVFGFLGGMGTAMAASYGVGWGQQAALDEMTGGGFSAELARSGQAHGTAAFAGDLAAQLPFFRLGWSGLKPALGNAALSSGIEAGTEAVETGEVNPWKVAGAGAFGMVLKHPTLLGEAMQSPAHFLAARIPTGSGPTLAGHAADDVNANAAVDYGITDEDVKARADAIAKTYPNLSRPVLETFARSLLVREAAGAHATPDEKAATNVIESDTHAAATNPLVGPGAAEEHGAKLAATTAALETDSPLPDVSKPAAVPVPALAHDAWHAAVAKVESGDDPDAVSEKGALGRMQVMPETLAKPGYGIVPAADASDAERSRVGHQLLDKLGEKYGDQLLATAAYNAGPRRVAYWLKKFGDPRTDAISHAEWVRQIPDVTQKYVRDVYAAAGAELPEGAALRPELAAAAAPGEPAAPVEPALVPEPEGAPAMTPETYVDRYEAGEGQGRTAADREMQDFARDNGEAVAAELAHRADLRAAEGVPVEPGVPGAEPRPTPQAGAEAATEAPSGVVPDAAAPETGEPSPDEREAVNRGVFKVMSGEPVEFTINGKKVILGKARGEDAASRGLYEISGEGLHGTIVAAADLPRTLLALAREADAAAPAEVAPDARDVAAPRIVTGTDAASRIYDDFHNQLLKAGIHPEVARQSAALIAKTRMELARRLREDPLAYHQANPLEYRRGADGQLEPVSTAEGARSFFQGGVDNLGGDRPEAEPAKGEKTGISLVNSLAQVAKMARDKTYAKGRDFKVDLQKRARAAQRAAGINLRTLDDKNIARLADYAFADAKTAIEHNRNAIGWYDRIVTAAKQELLKLYPELSDPEHEFAFIWALAVTSNGLKVNANFKLAADAYEAWRATGRFPTDVGIGKAAQGINDGLRLHQELIDRLGSWEAARDLMIGERTVREVEKLSGKEVSGEGKGETVRGAAILGPKIGNGFFSNLYGYFDALTMDRWLIRSVGRWRGSLIEKNLPMEQKKRAEIRGLLEGLGDNARAAVVDFLGESGIKVRPVMSDAAIDELANGIAKASQKPAWREAMNQLPDGEPLRLAANMHAKYLDGQVEAPAGPKERVFLRKVFNQALERLRQEPGFENLTMADLQAVLWYPEKLLYESARKKPGIEVRSYVDDDAPDYANAARNLVRDRLGSAGRGGPDRPGAGGPGPRAVEDGPGAEGLPPRGLEQAGAAGEPPRGRITIEDGKAVVDLFKNADASTIVHETAHSWLEELRRLIGRTGLPEDIRADWETLKSWWSDNGHEVTDEGVIPTAAHEDFARGFEQYMREGKSPNSALARVFESFKTWLTKIYKTVRSLDVPLDDRVRGVFDRMLGVDEAPATVGDTLAEGAGEERPPAAVDEGPPQSSERYSDPNGEADKAQADAIEHDLRMAVEPGAAGEPAVAGGAPQQLEFQLEQDGPLTTIKAVLDDIDSNRQALDDLRACLPGGGA